MWANLYVSASKCVYCAFSLSSFLVCLLIGLLSFDLSCLILFYYYFLDSCLFLTREERQGMNLDGEGGKEDLGRVKAGKTIIRIYCMKNNFNKRYACVCMHVCVYKFSPP